MKNTLKDLNNHLFAQLERLSEEDLSPEQLAQETERSKAVVSISNSIINNAKTQLEAVKLLADGNYIEASGVGIRAMLGANNS